MDNSKYRYHTNMKFTEFATIKKSLTVHKEFDKFLKECIKNNQMLIWLITGTEGNVKGHKELSSILTTTEVKENLQGYCKEISYQFQKHCYNLNLPHCLQNTSFQLCLKKFMDLI